MKKSLRARRMARNHKRMKSVVALNLVPIIDIFTMLLFFLMVNSGSVEVLEADKTITLPVSSVEKPPEETLVVKVNATEITVQGRRVATVSIVMAADSDDIPGLRQELAVWSQRNLGMTEEEKERGHSVTIMGDQKIPYRLLKRVMATCAQADFRDIALAVNAEDSAAAAPAQGG
jgi:biopolymer transport protein ExbD